MGWDNSWHFHWILHAFVWRVDLITSLSPYFVVISFILILASSSLVNVTIINLDSSKGMIRTYFQKIKKQFWNWITTLECYMILKPNGIYTMWWVRNIHCCAATLNLIQVVPLLKYTYIYLKSKPACADGNKIVFVHLPKYRLCSTLKIKYFSLWINFLLKFWYSQHGVKPPYI